ncbi:MAG TPA: VWA domain-containing protein [Pyrinomonadaceae bacterium]|nr:VWA domain-containing protein [Pyrinomonadaceae bacterium]
MLSLVSRRFLVVFLLVAMALTTLAQTRPSAQKPNQQKPATTSPERPPEEPQEIETLKTDTDLVTVPVIASDHAGTYITDLRQEEFNITEDEVPQQIAFFGKVAAPFHVVLMLDTSSSTKDKLKQIQGAASVFVQQLQPADRVKVISFDDRVKDHNEFTSNRDVLNKAIYDTRSGEGTKVYDAFELALNTIRKIRGRKAIVIFTDGVDWHSDSATFDGTLRWLDEEGVVVYPIRYDTRATTEQIAREGGDQTAPQLPTIDVIRKPPSGTTPPTFPGGDPVPTVGTQRTPPFGLPRPEDILGGRRREEERERDRQRRPPSDDPGLPPDVDARDRRPRNIPGGSTIPPTTTTRRDPRPDDSITRMLDMAYMKADEYLAKLAEKSGGRMLRADTLVSLPDAFSQIAAELRTQYLLGYYPTNKERDERYRKIGVKTTRKGAVIRSRPGYIATATK